VEKLLELHGVGEPVTQGFAFHKLHDEEDFVFRFQNIIDGRDPGVIAQPNRALRLFHEPASIERIVAQRRRKALERDRALQARILSTVNLAHPSGADAVLNLKPPRNRTGEGIPGGIAIHRNWCRLRHKLHCLKLALSWA